MNLFIVGKHNENESWEFQGVFDDEQLAIAACLTYEYFIGPVELNVAYPETTVEWPGLYYPIQCSDTK